ncbi:hypothetical protein [Rhizobium sp. FKL33]|uniref:hypothetical protein n=1 Tax=Rhizobium sp. FKL33 TaxID=2562307 RepID=UPI0010C06904|nr:hypothetical protein [Rhizobium sp. FKL33]
MKFSAWIVRRGPQSFVAAGLVAYACWLLDDTLVFWPSWASGNRLVLEFVYGPGPEILSYLGLITSFATTIIMSAWIYGAVKLLRRENDNFSLSPWVASLSIYAPVLIYIMPLFALSQIALHTKSAGEQPVKRPFHLGAMAGALFSLRFILSKAITLTQETPVSENVALAIDISSFVVQLAFFVTTILFMRRMQRLHLDMLAERPVA